MRTTEQIDLTRVKPSFVTRRVNHNHIDGLDPSASNLVSGDLVLARVEVLGQHERIERPDGRRARLFPGDEVLLACGARYAPDQFEADCPTATGPAHLAAAGGIAGIVRTGHDRMKPATLISILGGVCDRDGHRINLRRYGVAVEFRPIDAPVFAVCGTSMNAGKTHTMASIVRGFALHGKKVAAIKVTGTGAGGDCWHFRDSGAHLVRDFTDAGFATTYGTDVADIFTGAQRLIAEAAAAGADIIVLELADGLFQAETAGLLQLEAFRQLLTGVVFAAGDAMGAEAGAAWLLRAGHELRAISGRLTQSPLAMRELANVVDLPCLAPADLLREETVAWLAGDTFTAHVPTAA